MQSFITEGPCGYYPERATRNHMLSDENHEFSQAQITRILNKGYRRFGPDYYRTFCRGCSECTPYRVLAAEFRPNRSFSRVLARNNLVDVRWAPAKASQEKFELYVRYQLARHKDFGDEPLLVVRQNLAVAMIRQMYMNPQTSLELTISEGDRVLGFATFDVTEDSLSAVYSVFEPEMPERSLGTLNILLSLQQVKAMGLKYLNLGLYLEEHPKMSYKGNFGPAEVYRGFSWKPKT